MPQVPDVVKLLQERRAYRPALRLQHEAVVSAETHAAETHVVVRAPRPPPRLAPASRVCAVLGRLCTRNTFYVS